MLAKNIDDRTFLFWNIQGKPLYKSIGQLCRNHNVDFLALAECELDDAKLLNSLKSTGEDFRPLHRNEKRIAVFGKLPHQFFSLVRDPVLESKKHATAFRVADPMLAPFTLIVVHLIDRRNWDKANQDDESARYGDIVRRLEKQSTAENRTVIVGDFNMAPFERGMIKASGFHAVMTRAIAKKKQRQVQGEAYRMYYNPMWNLFGERGGGPPGTYYIEMAKHDDYFWYFLDQVILSPEMVDRFPEGGVSVLDFDGHSSLLKEGKPDRTNFSDHLPLLFQLNLGKELPGDEST
jgi:endonuclease/exonuclease/phosphatase family metal-dependent hydrolase